MFRTIFACLVLLALGTRSARAQTVTNCTSNGSQTQCATSSPTTLTTYETCTTFNGQRQCNQSGVPPVPLLGVGLKQTNCVGNGNATDCKTTSPTELTTYTSCHSTSQGSRCDAPSAIAPPSLALPTPAEQAQADQQHQAELQNEARGAVVIGRGVAGIFHAIHASNRKAREQRLADLNARFVSLNNDYGYGATLVAAAQARGDTAAVRRLSADQEEMSRQLTAIADSANRLTR